MQDTPQLLKIIQDNAQKTDNKCGLTAVQLCKRSGIPFAEIRKQLNDLYVAGSIQVREGIHGKLIFNNQQL